MGNRPIKGNSRGAWVRTATGAGLTIGGRTCFHPFVPLFQCNVVVRPTYREPFWGPS